MFPATVSLLSFVLIVHGAHLPKTAVRDAAEQSSQPLRCWEPEDPMNPESKHVLSEPIYQYCYYFPFTDLIRYLVSGVDIKSDDYTNIANIFANSDTSYAPLSLCLTEGFQLSSTQPSNVMTRCFCKRSGCNLPGTFAAYLDFNSNPIPKLA